MPDSLRIAVLVKMRLKCLRVHRKMVIEIRRKSGIVTFVANKQFNPVAGRKDKSFANSRMRKQRLRLNGKIFRSDSQALTQLYRRRLVVEARQQYLHSALNL